MMRLKLRELLGEYNRTRTGEDRLIMKDVAQAVNIPIGTLSTLSTFTRRPVTNTAYLEAILRYFSRLIPDFQINDLLDFEPSLNAEIDPNVDLLYPNRKRNRQAPDDEGDSTDSPENPEENGQ